MVPGLLPKGNIGSGAGFRPAWQALEKVRQLNQFSEGRPDEEKILEIAHAISEDFNSFGSFGASQ